MHVCTSVSTRVYMIGKIRMPTCIYLYICIDMDNTCICLIKIKTKDLCIHIHMYTFVYRCIHLCVYVYVCTSVSIYIYIFISYWPPEISPNVCTYVYLFIHLSTDITYLMSTHKHFHTYNVLSTHYLVIKVRSIPNITDFLMVSLKTACLTNRACAKMLMHILIATFVHTDIFSIYIHMFVHMYIVISLFTDLAWLQIPRKVLHHFSYICMYIICALHAIL